MAAVERIIITASGVPSATGRWKSLRCATLDKRRGHPNLDMGQRITIAVQSNV